MAKKAPPKKTPAAVILPPHFHKPRPMEHIVKAWWRKVMSDRHLDHLLKGASREKTTAFHFLNRYIRSLNLKDREKDLLVRSERLRLYAERLLPQCRKQSNVEGQPVGVILSAARWADIGNTYVSVLDLSSELFESESDEAVSESFAARRDRFTKRLHFVEKRAAETKLRYVMLEGDLKEMLGDARDLPHEVLNSNRRFTEFETVRQAIIEAVALHERELAKRPHRRS
jgi:hypothetical protein